MGTASDTAGEAQRRWLRHRRDRRQVRGGPRGGRRRQLHGRSGRGIPRRPAAGRRPPADVLVRRVQPDPPALLRPVVPGRAGRRPGRAVAARGRVRRSTPPRPWRETMRRSPRSPTAPRSSAARSQHWPLRPRTRSCSRCRPCPLRSVSTCSTPGGCAAPAAAQRRGRRIPAGGRRITGSTGRPGRVARDLRQHERARRRQVADVQAALQQRVLAAGRRRPGRAVLRETQPAPKCLVLDCDNTLWGGVVGEDGVGGIELGVGLPGQRLPGVPAGAQATRNDRGCCSRSPARTTAGRRRRRLRRARRHGPRARATSPSGGSTGTRSRRACARSPTSSTSALDSWSSIDDSDYELAEIAQRACPRCDLLQVPEELGAAARPHRRPAACSATCSVSAEDLDPHRDDASGVGSQAGRAAR